ncbi:putative serine protease 47 [Amphiura filiformis]|uniref:putative serine protease 47 n=1 Tax=Amphiura filiformis TaxID=82378 RepID=UPI003B216B13
MDRWKEVVTVLVLSLAWISCCSAAFRSTICGLRPAIDRPQSRIFNGRDAALGAWPWIGRMIPEPDSQLECIVVLIGLEFAVTPTLCVDSTIKSSARNTKIVFGDNEVGGSSPYRQEVEVRRSYKHPEAISFQQYDLAVLQFDPPVNITDYVSFICLDQNELEAYEDCWIAGWGSVNILGRYKL